MYAKRKGARKFTKKRTAGTINISRASIATALKKAGYGKPAPKAKPKSKYATVSFSRDVENKYYDKAIYSEGGALSLAIATLNPTYSGVAKSTVWRHANVPGNSGPVTYAGTAFVQDLFKGLPQGTNATSRVGNVIRVKYLKGNITFTAATIKNATANSANAQYGEALLQDAPNELVQFLRTTVRCVIVRDLQVNSTSEQIEWATVFSNLSGTSGVHSELNVANMGRFKILSDKLIELDADDPQKTVKFIFRGLGNVRYSGPEATAGSPAGTDTGVYVIWASSTHAIKGAAAGGNTLGPMCLVSSRLCFTDS